MSSEMGNGVGDGSPNPGAAGADAGESKPPPRRKPTNAWISSIVSVAICVCVATGLVWAGGQHGSTIGGWSVFALCALLSFALNWLVFVHAWFNHTERFFDITGSVTYILMVGLAIFLVTDSGGVRGLVLAACVFIWALRLGPFLFLRIRKDGHDRRFVKLKFSFPRFFMTWTLQATWVFITACCALAAITSSARVPLGSVFYIGMALWVFGFAIEVIADRQKSAFRADPQNAGQFINQGLWAWSRHPNYFGEIVLWCGIAVMATPALAGWQFVTLISPLFVVFLLTRVSGIPMLEARGQKEWGNDADYQAYVRNTPSLMLWPPRQSVQE